MTGLLPDNATPWERAVDGTSSRIIDVDTDIIRRARDPNVCPLPILPLLGWERSVHRWTGDPAVNRSIAGSSFADHLAYGSPVALEAEISADVGSPVALQEWFEAGLSWPRFRVCVEVVPDVVPPAPGAVRAAATRRKNVRDVPVVQFTARSSGPVGVAAQLCVLGSVRILPADPTPRLPVREGRAAALRVFARYNVRPYQ